MTKLYIDTKDTVYNVVNRFSSVIISFFQVFFHNMCRKSFKNIMKYRSASIKVSVDSRIDRVKALFGPLSEDTQVTLVAVCYGLILSTLSSIGIASISWGTWDSLIDLWVKWYKTMFIFSVVGLVISLCLLPFSKAFDLGVGFFGVLLALYIISIPLALIVMWGIGFYGDQVSVSQASST